MPSSIFFGGMSIPLERQDDLSSKRVDLIKQLPFTMGKAESDWPTNNIVRDMVCLNLPCKADDSPRKASSQGRLSAKV